MKGSSRQVRIFETYKDQAAYESHLQSPHFKKYKETTHGMVKSLKLIETDPIMLRAIAAAWMRDLRVPEHSRGICFINRGLLLSGGLHTADSFGYEGAVGWSGLAIGQSENVLEADSRVIASLCGFVDERPREIVQAV